MIMIKKNLSNFRVFSDLIHRNKSDAVITSIDLENDADIKVFFRKIMVKVGSLNDMENKLNKAINIITQKNLGELKGYIDFWEF